MNRFFFVLLTILLMTVLMVSGCRNELGNPRPEDFLHNERADIFQLDGIVYSHVRGEQELNYTLGEQVGEIVRQTDKAWRFKDGSANKLPVGAKIYETDTEITIVIVDGKEIPYIKMLEG
ncbi:MAG: hypothetical protein AB2392_08585 [Neobacillus sp.]